ncbi:DUF3226 domain-containing protein [Thermodesulfobium sp. 4217-1]|uniref:DUF3226 domain-containing protein n=1 Tax=Thermodesulfobium sp. 4217-1 TaxID=3120013 RepID=UPI0032217E75
MSYKFYDNDKGNTIFNEKNQKCIFLAEGLSEALFLEKWLSSEEEWSQKSEFISVICFQGVDKIKATLKRIEQKIRQCLGVGFFLDAEDKKITDRLKQIEDVLEIHKIIDTGTNKLRAGELNQISDRNLSSIAIYISPNNKDNGCIEDIVVEENEIKTWKCIECLRESSEYNNINKSIVQAYLGCKKPGLCGTGRGFESGILDVNSSVYSKITDLFSKLLRNSC